MEEIVVSFGAFFGLLAAIFIIKLYNLRANRLERNEFIREISVGSPLYNPYKYFGL